MIIQNTSLADQQHAFLEAYELALLNTAVACRSANVSRSDVTQWRLRWPDFDRACVDIEEAVLDRVETCAVQLAIGETEAGHPAMIKEVLTNLRRGRWKKPDSDGPAGTLKLIITDGMATKLEGGDAQV